MMIPFFDLKSQYRSMEGEIKSAVLEVLEGGWFVLGEKLKRFEEEFAAFTGSAHAVGVGSGTEAIHLALIAAGVKPGDRVVTVSNTAVPTVSAIRFAGATPVFVDINPATYTIDASMLEETLAKTDGITAIVPVHLYGQTADMEPILKVAAEHGLKVIEDACQAHGAEYRGKKAGSIGLMGCFSFYPSKNLGAYGDGGIIVTDDSEVAQRLTRLRNYGQSDRYNSVIEGFNSRLDEVQAAVLSVKLRHLERWIERRRELSALYGRLLSGAVTPVEADYSRHAYHLYVVRHRKRDSLMEYLKERGVATLIHYPIPIHLQEAYAWMKLPKGSLPETERAAGEILSLPIYPELTEEQVERVAELINSFNG